jgi:hypothetical protein
MPENSRSLFPFDFLLLQCDADVVVTAPELELFKLLLDQAHRHGGCACMVDPLI